MAGMELSGNAINHVLRLTSSALIDAQRDVLLYDRQSVDRRHDLSMAEARLREARQRVDDLSAAVAQLSKMFAEATGKVPSSD